MVGWLVRSCSYKNQLPQPSCGKRIKNISDGYTTVQDWIVFTVDKNETIRKTKFTGLYNVNESSSASVDTYYMPAPDSWFVFVVFFIGFRSQFLLGILWTSTNLIVFESFFLFYFAGCVLSKLQNMGRLSLVEYNKITFNSYN